ncbi:hypothetical protein O9992_16405 [Vibrio lentus]|nr:hypothetical protein [Vibrio lentus]
MVTSYDGASTVFSIETVASAILCWLPSHQGRAVAACHISNITVYQACSSRHLNPLAVLSSGVYQRRMEGFRPWLGLNDCFLMVDVASLN